MKKHQRVKQAFNSLIQDIPISEQYLLLMISNQTKGRNVLRFEGKINIDAGDYKDFTKDVVSNAEVNSVIQGLSSRFLDLSDNENWHLIPLIQEAGSLKDKNKVFISFNQNIIACLPDIESTLAYTLGVTG